MDILKKFLGGNIGTGTGEQEFLATMVLMSTLLDFFFKFLVGCTICAGVLSKDILLVLQVRWS